MFPGGFRQPFEDVVAQINLVIAEAVDRIAALIEAGGADGELRHVCSEASRTVQKLMDIASAIIHGSESRFDQREIDGLLGR